MVEHSDQVLEALRKVPGFENPDDVMAITRLGGLTNLVHRVDLTERSIIVRIPGQGTEDYIDREVEAYNANAASKAGVSPSVIHVEPSTGIMISDAVSNIETMTPKLFKERKGSPSRAGVALAQLHNSGQEFKFRFELFSMIDEYLKIVSTKDVNLPSGYQEIVSAAEPIKEILANKELPLAPCHCDPLCENFLDDGKKMWIVDWEYSGMNDPLWDVGDLSVEAGMTADQESEMMVAYFGREPTAAENGRVIIYKAMCDLLWTLWGLIQHADNNPAEDFWAYSTGRFDRCKLLMFGSDFQKHLDSVRDE